ncbi:MAG: FadR family transcriptional regulator [Burkholderiaceae bacterium]|nr:FadR family transcriptional regulator [Burkholderiaceae bacterium]
MNGKGSPAVSLTASPKKRVFEEIAQFLQGAIVSGRLKPGDRLKPERDLAAQLNVSRGSLREALKALEIIGVVEIRHGLGVYVCLPDASALSKVFGTLLSMQPGRSEDVLDARIAIECHAVRLACRFSTPSDILRMRIALDNMRQDAAEKSSDRGARDDHEFHAAIVDSTRNTAMIFLYSSIAMLLTQSHHQRWQSLFAISDSIDQLNEGHAAILQAIEARDEAAAVDSMTTHFKVIDALLKQGPVEAAAAPASKTAASTRKYPGKRLRS